MLAFDIGCYNGDSTEKILQYYDKIICVDANPNAISEIKKKFKDNKSIKIIHGCISNKNNNETFFISSHPIWCSCIKEIAKRDKQILNIIEVPSLNIVNIIDKYGCPDYLKCDIEGYDIILLNQLMNSNYRPKYISCESECIGLRNININNNEDLLVLNALKDLEYNKFVLIDQHNNIINESLNIFEDYDFSKLDKFWISYDEIKNLIRSIDRNRYNTFHFWYDIIATY